MTSQLEFASRAALCKQLAKREPANRALWMAEAGKWTRLSKETFRGKTSKTIGSTFLANLQSWSVRCLSAPCRLELQRNIEPGPPHF
jgi:hypothetical protein